jgi:hypothetical protein
MAVFHRDEWRDCGGGGSGDDGPVPVPLLFSSSPDDGAVVAVRVRDVEGVVATDIKPLQLLLSTLLLLLVINGVDSIGAAANLSNFLAIAVGYKRTNRFRSDAAIYRISRST